MSSELPRKKSSETFITTFTDSCLPPGFNSFDTGNRSTIRFSEIHFLICSMVYSCVLIVLSALTHSSLYFLRHCCQVILESLTNLWIATFLNWVKVWSNTWFLFGSITTQPAVFDFMGVILGGCIVFGGVQSRG